MDDREREQKRIDEKRQEIERRKWLISVSDEDAGKLCVADRYDRIRYLRFEDSQRFLRDQQAMPAPHWNREWKSYYQGSF